MNSKIKIMMCTLCFCALSIGIANAQVSVADSLHVSLFSLFEIAKQNGKELKLAKTANDVANADYENVKTLTLPSIKVEATAGYAGNVGVIGLGNMASGFYPQPHFANSYSAEASLMIFSGGRIKNNIDQAALRQKLSEMNFLTADQEIKLLIAGYYLELETLLKQRKVYQQNIEQSRLLLQKIKFRYESGVVLKSDYTRNDLLVANMELSLLKLNNRITILNDRLTEILDLPDYTVIVPANNSYPSFAESAVDTKERIHTAESNNPDLKIALTDIEIEQKTVGLAKSERLPSLSLYASNGLQRPFVYDLPAVDIYYNIWSAGLKLSYNVSGLYTNSKKIKAATARLSQAQASKDLTLEKVHLAVKEANVRYRQSIDELAAMRKELQLASENYRRIINGYNQQLALITEVMDASNAKLAAELQLENAQSNIAFTYYQLLRTTGKL
jgi:outer membrane protein